MKWAILNSFHRLANTGRKNFGISSMHMVFQCGIAILSNKIFSQHALQA